MGARNPLEKGGECDQEGRGAGEAGYRFEIEAILHLPKATSSGGRDGHATMTED